MQTKNKEINVTAVIRELLSKYSLDEIQVLKPKSLLADLEKHDIKITTSVRSILSKILTQARKEISNECKISKDIASSISNALAKRSNLAVELLKECNGDFGIAKSELERALQVYTHNNEV